MSRRDIRPQIIGSSMLVFVVGVGLSMWAYPGGTWWHPKRPGHSFWENFLCDLLHRTALNSRPNQAGAAIATIALLSLTIGVGVFWSMAGQWIGDKSSARWLSRLGMLGASFLVTVSLTPSDRYPRWHTVAVLLGGLPALVTCLWFCSLLIRRDATPKGLRVLSWLLCLLLIVCLGLYAQNVSGGPALRILPALERLTVATLLVWMLAVLGQPVNRGSR